MEKEKDTFGWGASVSAPEFYPVQVIRGAFYKGDEFLEPIPNGQGIVEHGWGIHTDKHPSVTKLLPDGMAIEWFSFAENKFYSGSFDLPYDTIKKLFNSDLLRHIKQPGAYDEICVGMAPGGMVVVWVVSSGDGSVDIGRFQAHEAPARDLNEFLPQLHKSHDWEDRAAAQKSFADAFMDDPRKKANFQKNGLSPGLYDSYRQKYNIRITPNFEDKTAIVDQINIYYYSGEYQMIALEQLKDTSYSLKAPIERLWMVWSFGRKMQYVDITMDEAEIFDIYKQMYEDDPKREIELRIDVNKENNFVRAWFSQPGQQYPRELELVVSDIGIYPFAESNRRTVTAFKDEYEEKYPYKRKDGRKDGE